MPPPGATLKGFQQGHDTVGLRLYKFRLSLTFPIIDLSGLRKHKNNDEPLGISPTLSNIVLNLGSLQRRDYCLQFKVEESDSPKVTECRDGRATAQSDCVSCGLSCGPGYPH